LPPIPNAPVAPDDLSYFHPVIHSRLAASTWGSVPGPTLATALIRVQRLDYYRGEPETLHAARRAKLAAARQRRKETNLKLRQRQLPLEHPGERC
jgi:hypothetical protein